MRTKEPLYPHPVQVKFARNSLKCKSLQLMAITNRKADMKHYNLTLWRDDYTDNIAFYDLIYSPENLN